MRAARPAALRLCLPSSRCLKTRPAGAPGVSGAGLLGAVVFDAVTAGPANLVMNVTALTPTAQPIATQVTPLSVVVK